MSAAVERAAARPAAETPAPSAAPLRTTRAARTADAPTAQRTAPASEPAAATPVTPPPEPHAPLERIALLLAALVLLAGWFAPLGTYLTPRSGFGYALGIVGGSLMLALLVYPARKRLPGLALLGSLRAWFRIHMVLGVVGPLCIVYHSGYHFGATNSNVALVSMLVVTGSGIVGRYFYNRIHYGVYDRKVTLEELRAEAEQIRTDASGAGRLLPEFGSRLDAAEQRVARGIPFVPKALSAALYCRIGRSQLHRYVHRTLRRAAAASPAIARHRRAFSRAADRYADARLTATRRLAEFQSCEQLFSLWHHLHMPLTFMLFIAGVVHVVAVNLY